MTIVGPVLDDVLAHAREEAPRECCGMLIGRGPVIARSVRARNLAESDTRFLIDPRDHVRAIRAARLAGLDVVGFYHSHPRSRAVPSPTDIAECGYAGAAHLIAGIAGDGQPEVRLFSIDGDAVVELTYRLGEAGKPEADRSADGSLERV
jgi:proteasome lid subunit RPN8/RPN11